MTLITQEAERRDHIGKAYVRCASSRLPDSETSLGEDWETDLRA